MLLVLFSSCNETLSVEKRALLCHRIPDDIKTVALVGRFCFFPTNLVIQTGEVAIQGIEHSRIVIQLEGDNTCSWFRFI